MAGHDRLVRCLRMRATNQNVVEINPECSLEVQDDKFYIVDPTTKTKRLRLDAGNVTAATDATVSATDGGLTTGGFVNVIDTGGVYATPIVLTAADSGKHYLLDDAAGLDFTLPAISAATVGMVFHFYLVTEVTSNNYRWTAQAGDLLAGHVRIWDKDAATGDANALIGQFRPDGSDDLIMTIKGSDDTQGSLVGGRLTFTALTATKWFVSGDLIGDGSLATPFS